MFRGREGAAKLIKKAVENGFRRLTVQLLIGNVAHQHLIGLPRATLSRNLQRAMFFNQFFEKWVGFCQF